MAHQLENGNNFKEQKITFITIERDKLYLMLDITTGDHMYNRINKMNKFRMINHLCLL